ncbi:MULTISPECIES: phosphoribosyltransferase domain-containing protein [Xanthomonas]|uniref:phosphoribosyltransferase domain-containing protein n=1 Tax=Xanthomonas TaxID=338 RepID=UPI000E1E3C46|nr:MULTISPECIES: phosphoribosyltransferase domain-containing protein [Xanthomonas]MEA9579763.1 phosphoribosyltransferase domain-containing protein [Xanthomonas nasturtii]
MSTLQVTLPTGTLHCAGQPGNRRALTDICGVGARRNPKRGFVFVSKVLGKHWPASPSTMAQVQAELAAQIPVPADEMVLFVALAETATGLGHGVFEAFLQRAGSRAMFLQTTRYPLDGAQVLRFEEEHSHATQQFLYLPESPALRAALEQVSTVVLVDDEATSGRTFLNLATALRAVCPRLRTVHPVVLTDFSEGRVQTLLSALPGIAEVAPISLWSGTHRFERDPGAVLAPAPVAYAAVACRRQHVSAYTARLGLAAAIALPDVLVQACHAALDQRPVLVIGTGECMYPAQRLAQALEALGHAVVVQSTTRSPLMQAGAIDDIAMVEDVYGEGIPNYLYNLTRSPGAVRIVVHESRERACVDRLVQQLQAIEVDLVEQRVTTPMQAVA